MSESRSSGSLDGAASGRLLMMYSTLVKKGSKGLIVEGVAVFSHQKRQNRSDRPYLALPYAAHMGHCRRILLPLDNSINIEVSANSLSAPAMPWCLGLI